jgi:hypothetical protein
MRNVSEKSFAGNQTTHFTSNKKFHENRAVYEIMWENMTRAGQATDGNTLQHMRLAGWIIKITNTHF